MSRRRTSAPLSCTASGQTLIARFTPHITLWMLLLAVVSAKPVQAATCKNVFSTLSVAGFQYSSHMLPNQPPKVVAGTVPLNVLFKDLYDGKHTFTGVSLRYTLDDQPIGPVLTDNFAWNWDTTTAPEGTHVLSVVYVNEPPPSVPCFTFLGREYLVVVENMGVPMKRAQTVPITGANPHIIGPLPPQKADYVQYPGFQPHATAHPYPYRFIPPAGGAPQSDYYSEPIETQLTGEGEAAPGWQHPDDDGGAADPDVAGHVRYIFQ